MHTGRIPGEDTQGEDSKTPGKRREQIFPSQPSGGTNSADPLPLKLLASRNDREYISVV